MALLFRGLDVDALERVLSEWAQLAVGQAPHLRIDGKTLRGSRDGECSAVQLLAAYCDEAQVVLAQERVADDENEVGAALRVLNRLPLAGAVVTGDALFAQQSVCTLIGKKGATTSSS